MAQRLRNYKAANTITSWLCSKLAWHCNIPSRRKNHLQGVSLSENQHSNFANPGWSPRPWNQIFFDRSMLDKIIEHWQWLTKMNRKTIISFYNIQTCFALVNILMWNVSDEGILHLNLVFKLINVFLTISWTILVQVVSFPPVNGLPIIWCFVFAPKLIMKYLTSWILDCKSEQCFAGFSGSSCEIFCTSWSVDLLFTPGLAQLLATCGSRPFQVTVSDCLCSNYPKALIHVSTERFSLTRLRQDNSAWG